jgi:hypothetical protein
MKTKRKAVQPVVVKPLASGKLSIQMTALVMLDFRYTMENLPPIQSLTHSFSSGKVMLYLLHDVASRLRSRKITVSKAEGLSLALWIRLNPKPYLIELKAELLKHV